MPASSSSTTVRIWQIIAGVIIAAIGIFAGVHAVGGSENDCTNSSCGNNNTNTQVGNNNQEPAQVPSPAVVSASPSHS